MDVVKNCVFCGEQKVIKVNQKGYDKWKSGACIQDALPKLSVDDREMLISGICGKCWAEYVEYVMAE